MRTNHSIFKAKVIEAIDGDIFRGEVNLGFEVRITRSFRVYGIDTPEIFRPKSGLGCKTNRSSNLSLI